MLQVALADWVVTPVLDFLVGWLDIACLLAHD
jgi:hypothetical protein